MPPETDPSLLKVYEQEKPRLLGFVRRQLRNLAHLDEEDLVSDVFASLWDRDDLLEDVENLVAYVYGALSRRIQDVLRHQSRSQPSVSMAAEELVDPDGDVELQAANAQLRIRIEKALQGLSAAERAVWIATEVEGQSFRELAERWHTPIGTLLSRKSRANARLRTLLQDYQT